MRCAVVSGYFSRSHGGTAYDGVPTMTEMSRSCAPVSTGSSQSRSKTPSSGSQVDQTDSPTRMTEKWAARMRSRSTASRSYGMYSG